MRNVLLLCAVLGLRAACCEASSASGVERLAPSTQPLARKVPVEVKYTLYERPSSVGTVARSESLLEDRRPAKIVHYVLRDHARFDPATTTPDMLAIWQVEHYAYDDVRREMWREIYDADGMLKQSVLTRLGADRKPIGATWYDAQGFRTYEQMYQPQGQTHLYYEKETLVGFRGRLSQDIDLPNGWGEMKGGLACSLAIAGKVPFQAVQLWVTVKNQSGMAKDVVTVGKAQSELLLELRDADGKLVPQDPLYVAERLDARSRMNRAVKDSSQGVNSGCAELVASSRSLTDWFKDLPPGKYTLRVQCRTGELFDIVSNPTAFEIAAH